MDGFEWFVCIVRATIAHTDNQVHEITFSQSVDASPEVHCQTEHQVNSFTSSVINQIIKYIWDKLMPY